jgi:large subunit ribosomal protein L2
MEILNPTTSSQRHVIRINNKNLNKKPILKFKLTGLKRSSGRNNSGKITSYHKGGGHKKRYRKLDFYRIQNSIGITTSIEYDPNRSANIASIYDLDKENYFYILAPIDLIVGDVVKSGEKLIEQRLGYSMPMEEIPVGSAIHNIALKKYGPAKITRSAGAYSYILDKSSGYCSIQLSSGKKCYVPLSCYATLGIVSNDLHFLSKLGKAGRSRWLNKRPTVRGVAMNPIDHPNGGGEGKKSGKGYTPWGKPKTKKA